MSVSEPTLTDQDGHNHVLSGTCIVGRSDDCDLVLASDKVSRHHARFTLGDGGVVVEDLGSSNGTRVNGVPINAPTRLLGGDCVAIDRFALTLRLPLSDSDTQPDAGAPGTEPANATVIDPTAGEAGTTARASEETGSPDTALPGSWVEDEKRDGTQFFSPGALSSPATVASAQRHGTLPQLIILAEDGSALEVVELETGSGGGSDDVWEIGRQSDCDVIINDDTVSGRHAQLIHRAGRWRMVNLVSANGIVVNGERRLSVYLDDGDVVELGGARLRFFAAADAPRQASPASGPASTAAANGGNRRRIIAVTGTAVLLALAAVAALTLL